jgi:hypothetical protein
MIEGAIKSIILSDGDLAARIGGRVRPITGVQGERRPFVAYEITNAEDPSPTHGGPSGVTRTAFDLVTVADTYADVAEITADVRRIVEGYTGTTNQVQVFWVRSDGETDIEQAPATGEGKPPYVRSQSFRALHKSAT